MDHCQSSDRVELAAEQVDQDRLAGFLDELRAQVKEAEQNLVTECNRYNDLWLQFDQLRASSDRLCNELAVMCEAQLVGDHNLVMRKVEQFTDRYRENFKQAAANGRVH